MTNTRFPDGASAIWFQECDQGRNRFARFRLSFTLNSLPSQAMLHLFADTSYQLFVNGRFVQYGLVRYDPRYPVYDTHHLEQWLVTGQNTIAVQVNYVGHKTFMNMPAQAGLAAWGCIQTSEGPSVNLATGVADWKVAEARAYGYAAKASLFLKAADHYDQRLDQPEWKETSFDDSDWPKGVLLRNQEAWGPLSPRTIPFMSGEPVAIEQILAALPLAQLEDRYSFSVPLPHVNEIHEPSQFSKTIAVASWIYSPKDCTVTLGLYQQQVWIEGQAVPPGLPSKDKSMRQNVPIRLKQGWNHYFCKIDATQDMLHHYLALPAGAGLMVRAERNPSSTISFRRTPVLTPEQAEEFWEDRLLPFSHGEALEEWGGWVDVRLNETGASPTMDSGWDDYGEPFEKFESPEELSGRTFSLEQYPNGFSLLLDAGMTRLALLRIKLTGAGGATIDLTFSEHLNNDGKHLKHTPWYGLGDRAIADERKDQLDWLLSQPRGFRYLKLTVRNPRGDISLNEIALKSASYPAVQRGTFQCSDPLLNQIWEMGACTEAVNMEDAYTDCVTRERGQYIRDTIIQYHNNLVLFGDQALMRRCLELIGQSPDETGKFRAVYPNTGDYTISDFALNALEGFRAYYAQTGDTALIETYWPAMLKNLAWFHELADEREDLLLDSEWDIKRGIKAHYGGFHGDLGIAKGVMDNTGIHCVFSCTYLIALRCALELANAIHKAEDAQELERRIHILERSIRAVFWDEQQGCYSDNDKHTTHSPHASLFAARAGVLLPEQLGTVQRHVQSSLRSLFLNGYGPESGVKVSPSFSFYIFEGLYLIGLDKTAEQTMRDGWGWFLQQGLRQTPEYFNLNLSLCHAWSACPTYFLSRHVLGILLPETDQPNIVTIQVQSTSVSEAEGIVPHRLGDIAVKWHMDESGKRIFDYIKVPDGLTAEILEN